MSRAMIVKSIQLQNYTVFEDTDLTFGQGINVFIGENATGKTHLLKLIYAACCANRQQVDFGNKIVMTMLPDEYRISRLITRKRGNHAASIRVAAVNTNSEPESYLSASFDNKTKKWNYLI